MLPRSGLGSGGRLTGERGRKGRKTQAGTKKDREGEEEEGEAEKGESADKILRIDWPTKANM